MLNAILVSRANCDARQASLNYGIVFIPGAIPTVMRPLDQLEQTIAARKAAGATDASYTARLLAGGVPKIGAKLLEEAGEAASAAGEPGDEGRRHAIHEAADVLYHLLVLLSVREIPLAEVEAELATRFNMSGLQEKASRTTPKDQKN